MLMDWSTAHLIFDVSVDIDSDALCECWNLNQYIASEHQHDCQPYYQC